MGDKRCSLIRKWHTMLECFCDAKTTQRHTIRARMREIIRGHITGTDLKGFVKKLSKSGPGGIGMDIRKSCQMYYPLKVALIEKVKVVRKPKKDVAKLMEHHELKHGFDPIREDSESEVEMSEDEDYSTNSDIE